MKSGDRPLRLKGYYRALKRGEPWAIKLSKKTGLDFWLDWIYHRHISATVYTRNPFLDLIPKDESSFCGKYFPVPVLYYEYKGGGGVIKPKKEKK